MNMIIFVSYFLSCIVVINAQSRDVDLVYHLPETAPTNHFVGNIPKDAMLTDTHPPDVIRQFEFAFLPKPNRNTTKYFNLDATSGVLSTAVEIDRELLCPMQEQCRLMMDVAVVKPINHFQVIPITVTISDVNDNSPSFPNSEITIGFSESSPVGTEVRLPVATDFDSPRFGVKKYALQETSAEFDLQSTGKSDLRIVSKTGLDRERVNMYYVIVMAYDGDNPPRTGTMLVKITVEDANDHSPVFTNTTYSAVVFEDTPVNSVICQLQASDSDLGVNGQIYFAFDSFTERLYGSSFGVIENTGDVYLKQRLDYEVRKEYRLEVTANDGGPNARSAHAIVMVTVYDVNDNPPQVTINPVRKTGRAEVMENMGAGVFVAHVSVFDADSADNGKVECSVSEPAFRLELLRKNQYKIVTTRGFDREERNHFAIVVECSDAGSPVLTGRQNLTVLVLDQNDNTPTFSRDTYVAALPENNRRGDFILKLNATDRDTGKNAAIKYELFEESFKEYVTLHPDKGVMRAAKVFDHEDLSELSLTVIAKDQGLPNKFSTTTVILKILDHNDEPPRLLQTNYTFSVRENSKEGTVIGVINAIDKDSYPNNQFNYSLIGGMDAKLFSIILPGDESGEIVAMQPLDREKKSLYEVTVKVTDRTNPVLSSTADVIIEVKDDNDNYPVIVFPTQENNTVYISNKIPMGYHVIKITASDADIGMNANLTYMLLEINGNPFADEYPIAIKSDSGFIVVTKDFSEVDYEEYEVIVVVADQGRPKRATQLRLVVVVDSKIPFTPVASLVKKNNLVIIIAVTSISGLIMVLLIIAIVTLKLYDRRRPEQQYRCRLEAERILNAAAAGKNPPPGKKGTRSKKQKNRTKNSSKHQQPHRDAKVNGNKNKNGVKKSESAKQSGSNDYRHNSIDDKQTVYISPDMSVRELKPSVSEEKIWIEQSKHLEAHLLAMLKNDQDSETGSYGEDSNTDSGRGASEKGEVQPCYATTSSDGFRVPTHEPAHLYSPGPYVPTSDYTYNQLASSPYHRRQCPSADIKQRTFSENSDFSPKLSTFPQQNQKQNSGDITEFNHKYTPHKTVSFLDDSCQSNSSRSLANRNGLNRSHGNDQCRDQRVEPTMNGSRGHLQNQQSASETSNRDLERTESIDANELCGQIEELFFKGSVV